MTRIEVPGHDLIGIRAANPGPFTLTGTNSWIVGRDPAWLVDPGPNLDDHVAALIAELEQRGGLGGIALTHQHADHTEAVPAIRARFPDAPLAAAAGNPDVPLSEGGAFGPLEVVATPGHAPDHLAYVTATAACADGRRCARRGKRVRRARSGRSGRVSGCAGSAARAPADRPPSWPRPARVRSEGEDRRVHLPSPRPRKPAHPGARRRQADPRTICSTRSGPTFPRGSDRPRR